jgi:hypothetical protein
MMYASWLMARLATQSSRPAPLDLAQYAYLFERLSLSLQLRGELQSVLTPGLISEVSFSGRLGSLTGCE